MVTKSMALEAARKLRNYLLSGIEGYKQQGIDRIRAMDIPDIRLKPIGESYNVAEVERLLGQLVVVAGLI